MRKSWLKYLVFVFIIATLVGCNDDGKAESTSGEKSDFPKQVAISVYDVGSSGYAEVSAIANAITTDYGTQLRLLPSGNGVGRMMVIRDQTTLFGRLGDEYQFAYRGDEEFSDKSWGPQDVTVVWQSMTHMNGAVLEKSDISKPKDLKGKKIPFLTAGASINYKTEALLAAGGLTWEDVEKVELTSYAVQAEALEQGRIDMATMLPGASALVEIAEMKGIRWIELPGDVNDEIWTNIQKVVPWAVPDTWSIGAGLTEGNPVVFMSYPYPFVAHKDVDEDIVYEFVKRIVATYDGYKNATASSFLLGKDYIKAEPLGVPIHPGAIRYLEEQGMWDDEKGKTNEDLIQYGAELKELWAETVQAAKDEGITDDKFAEFWLSRKEVNSK